MSPRWTCAEACPRCSTRPLYPAAWEPSPHGGSGVLAAYRCPKCGHVWTCGWGAGILRERGLKPPRRDAV